MASGYSGTPLAKKLSLRDGQRVWFDGMPDHVADEIDEYALELTFVGDPSEGIDSAHVFITERADLALRAANVERESILQMIGNHEKSMVELRAAHALLQLAMDQIKSTVWATDRDLCIQIVANGEYPSKHFGVVWDAGKTVFEIFKTIDRGHPAVACHLRALDGHADHRRRLGDNGPCRWHRHQFADRAGMHG